MIQPAKSPSLALAGAANRNLGPRGWLALLTGYMAALIAFGLATAPWPEIGSGWLRVLRSPGLLLSDYVEIGGLGAALVNAGLVGLAGLLLVQLNGVPLSGPTIAAIFTWPDLASLARTC